VALRRHLKPRRILILGAPIVLVGVAVVVFLFVSNRQDNGPSGVDASGLPIAPITATYISGRADAIITFPDATVFKTFVHPEGGGTAGSDDPAYVQSWLATQATAETVRSWYQMTLSQKSYSCYGGIGPAYMYTIDSYKRGAREEFWVGYINPHLLYLTYHVTSPQARTIFEIDYVIVPAAKANAPLPDGNCYFPLPSPYPSLTP
jgi:hypothetical protein